VRGPGRGSRLPFIRGCAIIGRKKSSREKGVEHPNLSLGRKKAGFVLGFRGYGR
jgi:hypothetical protein